MVKNFTQNTSTITFHIPEGIDPDIFKGNGERPARLLYVAHLLTTMSMNDRGFIAINKHRLRRLISKDAATTSMKILMPFIEIDHTYKVSKHSKGYRWLLPHREAPSKEVTFKCPKFIQRLKRLQTTQRNEYTKIEAGVDSDMNRISLGIDDLEQFIIALPDKAGVISQQHSRNCILNTGKQIQARDFGVVRTSAKTGRLHCLINRTSSAMRSHLLINGEAVTELDLASSQPYFLTTLFPQKALTEDVKKGEFYLRVNEQLPKPYEMNNPCQYTILKQSVLAALYARPKYGYNYISDPSNKSAIILEAMDKAYGGIKDFVTNYSRQNGANSLAVALQKAESGVVVDTILKKLQHSSIPSVTIHDAILCQNRHIDFVKSLMSEELSKTTGIEPLIRKKTDSKTG